jgi:hypothetical protein
MHLELPFDADIETFGEEHFPEQRAPQLLPQKDALKVLQQENLRLTEENRTIKASYDILLNQQNQRAAALTSQSASKRKLTLLQQELSDKTLFCQTISEKLSLYKQKCTSLKQRLMKNTEVQVLSTENQRLRALIEKLQSERADSCAVDMALRKQTSQVVNNADSAIDSLIALKRLLTSHSRETPSTSIVEEDKAFALENSQLGKRTPQRPLSPLSNQQSHSTESRKEECFVQIHSDLNNTKKLSTAKVSYTESSDESSLSPSTKRRVFAVESHHTPLIRKTLEFEQKSEDVIQPIASEVVKVVPAAAEPEVLQTIASLMSPFKVCPPSFLKAPSFLKPADSELCCKANISEEKDLLNQSTITVLAKDIVKASEPSCDNNVESQQNSFISRAWNLCTTLVATDSSSRKEYYDILELFKKSYTNNNPTPSALSSLLQTNLSIKSYNLKDLMTLRGDCLGEPGPCVLYVFQSVFTILGKSLYQPSSQHEQSLIDSLHNYINPDSYFYHRHQKILSILATPSKEERTHHFGLFKNIFSYLIYSLERIIVPAETEEHFSSQILAKRLNLQELKAGGQSCIEKMARAFPNFSFTEGLEDYLVGIFRFLQVCRHLEIVLNQAIFNTIRTFFSSHKYKNSSQQLVVCLVLRLLNFV